jgi:glycosyltransferase involved in cell wall biosynthesis
MRILVYPFTMGIGGSPINAVQLAGAVHERGHDVIVLTEPGPVRKRVREMGLAHLDTPRPRRRPSLAAIGTLMRVVREQRVDVVHAYESMPVIEAFFGPVLRYRTPVVGTVMSMSVVPYFPHAVRLTVGTEQIREAALAAGHRRVLLLEPPVDVDADNPWIDGRDFRAEHAVQDDEVLLMMVCRLVPELKLEGLLAACDAVGKLARKGYFVRLVIIGDGQARKKVADHAAKANTVAGRQVVQLTGEITDPRKAYAAADVIIGQGSSVLRGMAFRKPVVVVGEAGFVELLTPDSAPIFLRQGWYGLGTGSLGTGAAALSLALARLVISAELRHELGAFARQLVVDRFGLQRAARLLEEEYIAAMRERLTIRPPVTDFIHCAAGVLGNKVRRQYHRWRGTIGVDNPNGRPAITRFIAGGASVRQPVPSPARSPEAE